MIEKQMIIPLEGPHGELEAFLTMYGYHFTVVDVETPAKWETEITAMLDNMPACGHPNWMEEGTCATCADWRARPAEPATDARDAARYRWLCNGNGYFLEERGIAGHGEEKKAADEAIDAAMRSALSERG